MKVIFIYATWCPHCQEFLNHDLKEYMRLLKKEKVKFKMIESNENNELKKIKNLYNIEPQYFPSFFLIDNENKVHEVTPDDTYENIRLYTGTKKPKNKTIHNGRNGEILNDNKQYKLVLIYDNNNNTNLINNIYSQFSDMVSKTKKYAISKLNVNKINNKEKYKTLTPFFIIVDNTKDKSKIYAFNENDLKHLHGHIMRDEDKNYFIKNQKTLENNNIIDKKHKTKKSKKDDEDSILHTITNYFTQMFNDDFKKDVGEKQKVLKCSYAYDKNGERVQTCTEV
jgi:thiol-disulfide isomerase/thioredoxin